MLTQEQKQQIAQQLAERRAVMGDTGFQSYLNKIESAIPQARQDNLNQLGTFDTNIKPDGVLGKVSNFVGTTGLGTGAGAALGSSDSWIARKVRGLFTGSEDTTTKALEGAQAQGSQLQTDLIQKIREKKARGEDTTRLEMALQELGASQEGTGNAIGEIGTGGVSSRDVIGSAIRTAGTIASFGSYGGSGAVTGQLSKVTMPTVTSATTLGRGAWEGAKAGALTGAKMGGIFGGVSGTATGIEQGKGVLGTAFEAAKQATIGAGTGGVFGGVLGGVTGAVQARANRKAELQQLLGASDNVDEALAKNAADNTDTALDSSRRRAGFTTENGKVAKDPKAQELLRQGVEDKDVALMQSMSPQDKTAARKMLKIAQEASDSTESIARQQEVVGETFMRRAKDVEKLNMAAGKQIDQIARTQLAGKQIDYGNAVDDFVNSLQQQGVDTDILRTAQNADDIAKAFRGSAFDDMPSVQKTLSNAFKKVDANDLDGLGLHRFKRYLDNQVTYGKNVEGLSGDAERLLKGLRAGIDQSLDSALPSYNAANTQYRDTIDAIDEIRRLIGKEYVGTQNIQNLRAGEVANRLLGNASARPLSALQNLENVAKKYGTTYSDSVVKQIRFADLLDDAYQLHPTRGFTGQTTRGIEQAMGFADRLRTQGVTSAVLDTAGEAVQKVRGISPESQQKALEAFFNSSDDVAATVARHMTSADQVMKNLSADALNANGGVQGLITTTQRNIVDGLKAEGLTQASESIAMLNPSKFSTVQAFKDAVTKVIGGQAGAVSKAMPGAGESVTGSSANTTMAERMRNNPQGGYANFFGGKDDIPAQQLAHKESELLTRRNNLIKDGYAENSSQVKQIDKALDEIIKRRSKS